MADADGEQKKVVFVAFDGEFVKERILIKISVRLEVVSVEIGEQLRICACDSVVSLRADLGVVARGNARRVLRRRFDRAIETGVREIVSLSDFGCGNRPADEVRQDAVALTELIEVQKRLRDSAALGGRGNGDGERGGFGTGSDSDSAGFGL